MALISYNNAKRKKWSKSMIKKKYKASLVVQRLRICLPRQGATNSIPGMVKSPPAAGQLSLLATTSEAGVQLGIPSTAKNK